MRLIIVLASLLLLISCAACQRAQPAAGPSPAPAEPASESQAEPLREPPAPLRYAGHVPPAAADSG